MAIKEREIPPEIKKAFERFQKEYDERVPIDQKEIVNGQLKTTLFFDQEKPLLSPDWFGKDEYWRHVTQILVSDGNKELDLCSLAPDGVRFETDSAYYKLSKYEQGTPAAKVTAFRGIIIVIFNPKILELRGGNLMLLHEEGHAWQKRKRFFKKAGKARTVVCKYSRESQRTKEELLAARALLNGVENDAWKFAMASYQEIKGQGIDLASQLSKRELRSYPQTVYDYLYNREIWRALEVIGQKNKLRWKQE